MPGSIALQSLAAIAGLFGIGGALIGAGATLPAGRRQQRRLWTAWLVELATVGFIVLPAYGGVAAMILAMLLLTGAATLELQRALKAHAEVRLPWLALASGLTLVCAAGFAPPAWLYPLAALLLAANLLLAGWPGALAAIYPGFFAAHVVLTSRVWGFGAIVALFAIVEVNDAFAMVIGSSAGRCKLWPRLSPGKTLEGTVGGAVCAAACGLAMGFVLPQLTAGQRLAGSLVIVAAALAGDLIASAMKRWAGIKDFGDFVPVAGGVLDVYDSLIFSAPIFCGLLALAGRI